jgi:hypothetical protein
MSYHHFTTVVMAAALLAVPSLANNVEKTPGFTTNIPGTDTELRVYGSVRVDVTRNEDEDRYFKDPLLPSRVDGPSLYAGNGITATNRMNIDKSRFGLSTVTPNARLGNITTRLEFEADGGYGEAKVGVKLRQATIGFGNWLIGRAESTFVDAKASPEVLSPSAPIGQPNFSVSNFNLIRYTAPISRLIAFAASLEDSVSKPKFSIESNGFVEYFSEVTKDFVHNSRCPTMVGALTYGDSWGHIGVRVLEQNWSVADNWPVAHNEYRKASRPEWACAAQLSGAVNIGVDKWVGTIYTGKGLGDYGANAPLTDNILDITEKKLPGNIESFSYKVALNHQTGWQLGYTHSWNDKVRSNIAISCINAVSHDAIQPYVKYAQDRAVNTIVNIAKGVEVGMEYLIQKTKVNKNECVVIPGHSDIQRIRAGDHLYSHRISMVLTAKF